MSVPDKIYLAFEDGFVAQASTTKKDANGNNIFLSEYIPIEYIRKDALFDKLYKWMDKETTVTDYYSKEDFKKVIDNLF